MGILVRDTRPTPEQQALFRRLLADQGVFNQPVVLTRDEAMRLMTEAMLVAERHADVAGLRRRHCRVCACTEITACRTVTPEGEVPCGWAAIDLCTACEPFLEKPA